MTRKAKVVTCCPENRFCPRDEKNQIKSPVHLFELIFYTACSIQSRNFQCSEFFDLSCRSTPNKLFTTCWSVFHRLCPVLPFLRFANLSLLFLCKNILAILRNSIYSIISSFTVEKNLFYCGY